MSLEIRIIDELKDKTFCYVKLSWLIPPALIIGGVVAWLLGCYSTFYVILIFFFLSTIFIIAFSISLIMKVLKKRIKSLFELSEKVTILNNKLSALFNMTEAIGTVKSMDLMLKIVTSEIAHVMGVLGTSVKLITEDGKSLRYAAAHGVVDDIFKNKIIEIAKSPINRKIIEGDPFVTGDVNERDMFQFGEELNAAKVRSVLFAPLKVEDKVIGILGAYCIHPDRFSGQEVDYFRQAASLVAIAIENALTYAKVENNPR
ncbi:MAG: GAF domain-containing protein [Desulfobacterales bacterium]|nr:GAF domain-containing protein [Desulfobacterales bacterium]